MLHRTLGKLPGGGGSRLSITRNTVYTVAVGRDGPGGHLSVQATMKVATTQSSYIRRCIVITQQLRKVGNSYVLTVPKAEVERLQVAEGDFVQMDLSKMVLKPVLNPEIQQLFNEDLSILTPMLEYLKDK